MMTREIAAMTFVILSTMIGGLVGRQVGRISPEFVETIAFGRPGAAPPSFDAPAFGLGLGIVGGLFFGVGASLLLVIVIALRDGWVARTKAIHQWNASSDPA